MLPANPVRGAASKRPYARRAIFIQQATSRHRTDHVRTHPSEPPTPPSPPAIARPGHGRVRAGAADLHRAGHRPDRVLAGLQRQPGGQLRQPRGSAHRGRVGQRRHRRLPHPADHRELHRPPVGCVAHQRGAHLPRRGQRQRAGHQHLHPRRRDHLRVLGRRRDPGDQRQLHPARVRLPGRHPLQPARGLRRQLARHDRGGHRLHPSLGHPAGRAGDAQRLRLQLHRLATPCAWSRCCDRTPHAPPPAGRRARPVDGRDGHAPAAAGADRDRHPRVRLRVRPPPDPGVRHPRGRARRCGAGPRRHRPARLCRSG